MNILAAIAADKNVSPAFRAAVAPAISGRASQPAEHREADLAAHAAMRECSADVIRAAELIRGEQLFEADVQVLAWAMQQSIRRRNMHLPVMRDAVNLLRDLQEECAAAIREAA